MKGSPRVPRALFDWLTMPRAATIVAAVAGGYGYFAWSAIHRGDADAVAAIVTWSPIVAFVVAAPLIALALGFAGWTRERTWLPWHGRYYAFDDRQIRVVDFRGEPWFASDDVHAALDRTPREGVLRTLPASYLRRDDGVGNILSPEGIAALFRDTTDRRVLRLIAWAEREVRQPWRNRRDGVAMNRALSTTNTATTTTAATPVPSPPDRR